MNDVETMVQAIVLFERRVLFMMRGCDWVRAQHALGIVSDLE